MGYCSEWIAIGIPMIDCNCIQSRTILEVSRELNVSLNGPSVTIDGITVLFDDYR